MIMYFLKYPLFTKMVKLERCKKKMYKNCTSIEDPEFTIFYIYYLAHPLQVDNLQLLEEDSGQVAQVIANEESSVATQISSENVPSTSGQTVQVADGNSLPTAEEDATSALQALQYAGD